MTAPKSLAQAVKEKLECPECKGEGRVEAGTGYPNDYGVEMTEPIDCWLCGTLSCRRELDLLWPDVVEALEAIASCVVTDSLIEMQGVIKAAKTIAEARLLDVRAALEEE